MEGRKLDQVKEALRHILTDLNAGDTFNIIHFSDAAHKLGTMRYTGTAIRKAKKFINSLQADGGTNIEGALKESISQGVEYLVSDTVRPHIIVMLTDGQATVGITQPSAILRNVREKNKEGAAIFCLGFGDGADMKLLEKISLQNRGSSRRIYEDEDSAEQLKGFYEELSTPILLDVSFSYSEDAVVLDSLTNTHFYNYFHGTELVVAGQTESEHLSGLRANITGQGRNGQFFMGVTDWNTVQPPDHHLLDHLHLAPTPRNFIKRLWAFQKIKDMLSAEKAARGGHEKEVAQKKALKIALEHHFVTPLTSLVVVQPDHENCKDYEDDEEEDEEEKDQQSSAVNGSVDNNGTQTVSLDTQDSIVRSFNPESIQVLSDQGYNGMYPSDDMGFMYGDSQRAVAASQASTCLPTLAIIFVLVFHSIYYQLQVLRISSSVK
ncbi:hypothetical protein SK128_026320 [Halocaridina rubra]|uniref:VWFA domain-containing protein n=1 Tax=Halocaridina rubra TaxID=373956 RepID=A0AAN8WPI8_HALRR